MAWLVVLRRLPKPEDCTDAEPRETLTKPTDDATWERARGWALSQAVAALAYYTPENNPTLYREAEAWLELVLSEPG